MTILFEVLSTNVTRSTRERGQEKIVLPQMKKKAAARFFSTWPRVRQQKKGKNAAAAEKVARSDGLGAEGGRKKKERSRLRACAKKKWCLRAPGLQGKRGEVNLLSNL